MLQSKSKSELGFHFHFVSFHFTSFRFTSAHLNFLSYHFISFSFSFLFHFHFHFPSGFIYGFILFPFVSRDAENLAMTQHQKSSRVHWVYFFKFFWQTHHGSDAEAIRKLRGSRNLNFPIGPAGPRISEVPSNFSGSKVTAD